MFVHTLLRLDSALECGEVNHKVRFPGRHIYCRFKWTKEGGIYIVVYMRQTAIVVCLSMFERSLSSFPLYTPEVPFGSPDRVKVTCAWVRVVFREVGGGYDRSTGSTHLHPTNSCELLKLFFEVHIYVFSLIILTYVRNNSHERCQRFCHVQKGSRRKLRNIRQQGVTPGFVIKQTTWSVGPRAAFHKPVRERGRCRAVAGHSIRLADWYNDGDRATSKIKLVNNGR